MRCSPESPGEPKNSLGVPRRAQRASESQKHSGATQRVQESPGEHQETPDVAFPRDKREYGAPRAILEKRVGFSILGLGCSH